MKLPIRRLRLRAGYARRGKVLAQNSAEKIKGFADRGSALVRRLLEYSRTNPKDYQLVFAHNVLEEAALFAQALLRPNILLKVDRSAESKTLRFHGSHQEILQALINLISNSRDAMSSQEGKLTIRLYSRMPIADEFQTYKLESNKSHIFFEVEDTGTGIGEANLSRIFDPFFSTKVKDLLVESNQYSLKNLRLCI